MNIAQARSLKLTTVGRRTGRPHTVSLWFVPHRGRVYVSTDDRTRRDWCRNILKEPGVSLQVGGSTYRGQARLVEDDLLREELRALRYDRYRGAFMSMARTFVEIVLDEPV